MAVGDVAVVPRGIDVLTENRPSATATDTRLGKISGKIIGKDGVPMVLVSAGKFSMGAWDEDNNASNDERPGHPVYLDAFYIDQYEVTTKRYAEFLLGTHRGVPKYWSDQVPQRHGNKPVVGVDWSDAAAYCFWTGKRLPTEAEWEKAARGTDQRLYPWGNVPPNKQLANYRRCCNFRNYDVLTDVGSFEQGKSPYGTYDMVGNVWEWVSDWYEETYYEKSLGRNPKGPQIGHVRVVRSGSWSDAPTNLRSTYRLSTIPSDRSDYIGFRCAQDVPK